MSFLSNWLARISWFFMIQWMRRPWMKQAQLYPLKWLKGDKATKFYEKHKSQNRFARRIGLKLMQTVYFLLFTALLIQLAFYSVMKMQENNWLTPPQFEGKRSTDQGA